MRILTASEVSSLISQFISDEIENTIEDDDCDLVMELDFFDRPEYLVLTVNGLKFKITVEEMPK